MTHSSGLQGGLVDIEKAGTLRSQREDAPVPQMNIGLAKCSGKHEEKILQDLTHTSLHLICLRQTM